MESDSRAVLLTPLGWLALAVVLVLLLACAAELAGLARLQELVRAATHGIQIAQLSQR